MSNRKKIMIIAGGEWQVPLVRKAKERGLFVINTNLYENSPGFKYSDLGLVGNVLDKEKNYEYAIKYNIDAVITDQSDIAVSTVAYVAEKCGLPGIGINKAELFTNKNKMREFCVSNDFPTPQFKLCNNLNELFDFIEHYGLPVVVKPPANQSSRGVVKVNSNNDIPQAYSYALEHSHNQTVLIEEFIEGSELTVDGIQLNNGKHYCLATSIKQHSKHNPMVANKLFFSQKHDEINYGKLHLQHDALIKAMQLPYGLTHAEYIYRNGVFYLIEVAARGGGTKISSDIVTIMSGIDSNDLLIQMALGENKETIKPEFKSLFLALNFLEFDSGKVKSIVGLDIAEKIEGVHSIGLSINPGDILSPANDDRSRHGYVIAYSNKSDKLNAILEKVIATIKIIYE